METDDRRPRAIAQLKTIRAELERSKQLHPDPQTLIPAALAGSFNSTLELIRNELGDEQFRSHYQRSDSIIRTPKRKGGNPIVDAVGRNLLLNHVHQVLKRLGVED